MKQPVYRESLLHAWKFTMSHAVLWPVGVFAAILGGSGTFDVVVRFLLRSSGISHVPSTFQFVELMSATELAGISSPQTPWQVALYAVAFLMLALVLGVIWYAASIAHGTILLEAADPNPDPLRTIHESWHASSRYMHRLASIHLFRVLSLALISCAVGVTIVNAAYLPRGLDSVIYVCVFLLAAVLGISITAVSLFAIQYVLRYRYRLFEAIRAGWELFRAHILVTFEVGAMLFAVQLLSIGVFIFGLAGVAAVIGILWIFSFLFAGTAFLLVASILSILAVLTYVVLFGAWVTIFSLAAYSYLFSHMDTTGIMSRILHFVRSN